MSWLERRREKRAAEAVDHPAPVEIDLGIHRAFDVQLAIERMKDEGLDVYLYTQDQTVQVAALAPQRCHVLVSTGDETRVRAELEAAGLLIPSNSSALGLDMDRHFDGQDRPAQFAHEEQRDG